MSIIQRCSALHLRLANKLSPYLREKVVKRMMVHVANAVEKEVKSGMFPTRDTAVVTVSSNCCGHFRCERNFWCPNWDRKDPNCTSVCKVSWSVCRCSMSGCHKTSIFLQRPWKENCLDCVGELFSVTITFLNLQLRWVTVAASNGCQLERAGPLWLQEQLQQRM